MVDKVLSRNQMFVNKVRVGRKHSDKLNPGFWMLSLVHHIISSQDLPFPFLSCPLLFCPLLFSSEAMLLSCCGGDWLCCLCQRLLPVDPSASVTTGLLCVGRPQRNRHNLGSWVTKGLGLQLAVANLLDFTDHQWSADHGW